MLKKNITNCYKRPQKSNVNSESRNVTISIQLNQNPDDDEKALRLSAAIRLLRLQSPAPTNRVIMAALKDRGAGI